MSTPAKPLNERQWALKVTGPIFFAYFPIGLVFGVLFVQSGFPWWLGGLMSALIYSGSAQFVALSMYTQHASWIAILLAVFFIAFRNSFYGLSMLERYDGHWLRKAVLALLLVDATYAVMLANPTRPEHDNGRFCLWVSLWIWSFWVGGTLAGALFSRWIPPFDAFQFVLPAFFMSVAVDYWIKLKEWHIVIVPIVAAFVSYWLLPHQYLLLAIVLSLVVIVAIEHCRLRKIGAADHA